MTHPTDPANASVREACAQAAYRYIKEREIPGLAWRVRDLIQTIPILTAPPDPRDEALRLAREACCFAYDLITIGSNPGAFNNGVTDSTGTIDEGDVIASRVLQCLKKALAAIDAMKE